MITELLFIGRDNPRSGRDLAAVLHCGLRSVAKAVEQERQAGAPICATSSGNNPGYYLAGSKEDIAEYCDSLNHRLTALRNTRAAVFAAGKDLPNRPAEIFK